MEKIETHTRTRSVIKFLHLKGCSAQQIYDEMKAVYGDEGPLYSTVTCWEKKFQTGHMSLTDEPRSGRSSLTINGTYYSTLLNKLRDALKIKHHGMLTKGVLLLVDNAPAHLSQAALVEARQ